jgi:hypothetical protein
VTGIGSKNKPLIKAMTSSSIIFTIFVLGGGAYYILKWLDISSDDMLIKSHNKEMEGYNSNFPYLAPQMVCGGANIQAEMELPDKKLSWRSSHSPHEHSFNRLPSPHPSPRIPSPHIPSPRGRIPATSLLPQSLSMSPSLVRSRSDWSSYTGSTTNAELNYMNITRPLGHPFLSNDKNVRETSSFPDIGFP